VPSPQIGSQLRWPGWRKNEARLLILRAVSDLVSEQAGEVYGDIGTFNEHTQVIMQRLVAQLPAWLRAIPSLRAP